MFCSAGFTFVGFSASGPAGRGGPRARSRVLVEMQPVGAHNFRAFALDTVVEYVANLFFRMGKVSVTSRAQICGLRVFCGPGDVGRRRDSKQTSTIFKIIIKL